MNSSKDDPRAKQLSTGKKKFNIDPDKVSRFCILPFTELFDCEQPLFTGQQFNVHVLLLNRETLIISVYFWTFFSGAIMCMKIAVSLGLSQLLHVAVISTPITIILLFG